MISSSSNQQRNRYWFSFNTTLKVTIHHSVSGSLELEARRTTPTKNRNRQSKPFFTLDCTTSTDWDRENWWERFCWLPAADIIGGNSFRRRHRLILKIWVTVTEMLFLLQLFFSSPVNLQAILPVWLSEKSLSNLPVIACQSATMWYAWHRASELYPCTNSESLNLSCL